MKLFKTLSFITLILFTFFTLSVPLQAQGAPAQIKNFKIPQKSASLQLLKPDLKRIQSLLLRLGYKPLTINGVFDTQTRQALMRFQKDKGISPDGIIGYATWQAIAPLLKGYDTYSIGSGDTLFKIAETYHTTTNAIRTANPDIDPHHLKQGQRIVVPFDTPVVLTNIDYTYEIMESDIAALKMIYPFIEVGTIGKSVMGKNLYYIKLGSGPNEVFYNGAHHANEWITAPLLMKFIENYAEAYAEGKSIAGHNAKDIWSKSSIYIVPMVNPDGVNLITYWPDYPDPIYQEAARLHETATRLNKSAPPLPTAWKANIRGVDLNSNYPADWDKEHARELSQGITGPVPRDYGGPAPLSEPETDAVFQFTKQHNFRLILAYHTQGEVIYWQYRKMAPPIAKTIAQKLSRASGYKLESNPSDASYAGYKDWFVLQYQRPGFTVEVGKGTIKPLPLSQFPRIYEQNEEVMVLGALL